MDISLLSKMIGQLLLDHEEVGLPGLGAFMAEMVPASFSDKGYTINPPYRRVTFIPSRSEDDSLVSLYKITNIRKKRLSKKCKKFLHSKLFVLPLQSTNSSLAQLVRAPDC